MAIILESISGLVHTDSAERLFECVRKEESPLPQINIGRVSVQHSLEKLANSGTYDIDELISIGRGTRLKLRGTLRLFTDHTLLVGNNAEMFVWEQKNRSTDSYYLIQGKPTLLVTS
jgi:hypothetical protein